MTRPSSKISKTKEKQVTDKDTVNSDDLDQNGPRGFGKIYGGAMNINASVVDPVSCENVHGLIQHLVAHSSMHVFSLEKELILTDPITNRLFNTFMRRMPPVVQAVINSGAEFDFRLVVIPSENIQYELHLKTKYLCKAVPRDDGGFDVYEAKPPSMPVQQPPQQPGKIIIP